MAGGRSLPPSSTPARRPAWRRPLAPRRVLAEKRAMTIRQLSIASVRLPGPRSSGRGRARAFGLRR